MESMKKLRTGGILVGVLITLLGVLQLFYPMIATLTLEYVASAALVLFGVSAIVMYCKVPKEWKNNWSLLTAVFDIILGILLLFADPKVTLTTFAFVFAMMSMYRGIIEISSYCTLKKLDTAPSGLLILMGIANILLAIFLCVAPLMSSLAFALILGVYLIVGGISFIIQLVANK